GSLDDLASMLTDFGISSFSDFLPMVQDTTSTITTTFANPGTYTLSIEASDARGIIANASTTMVVVGE
ncbi:MAG: hypothetical protein P4L67_01990, partial [Candidatus Pacebacteria bacterium]|nr:hypothetical protein [Candidatus Paceibacterota bacterium]